MSWGCLMFAFVSVIIGIRQHWLLKWLEFQEKGQMYRMSYSGILHLCGSHPLCRHMQHNVSSCTLLVTPPAPLKAFEQHHSGGSQWHSAQLIMKQHNDAINASLCNTKTCSLSLITLRNTKTWDCVWKPSNNHSSGFCIKAMASCPGVNVKGNRWICQWPPSCTLTKRSLRSCRPSETEQEYPDECWWHLSGLHWLLWTSKLFSMNTILIKSRPNQSTCSGKNVMFVPIMSYDRNEGSLNSHVESVS